MSARTRTLVPFAAGLAVAAVAFAAVLLATAGGERSDANARAARPAALAASPGDARAGRAVFARMGCGSCHRLAAAGSTGQIGPPLDQVLPNHTAASLRAKIVDPGGGSIMPQGFARRMGQDDLRALVAFLLAARAGDAPR
jgi:mono/diheme cytochrome c family protein